MDRNVFERTPAGKYVAARETGEPEHICSDLRPESFVASSLYVAIGGNGDMIIQVGRRDTTLEPSAALELAHWIISNYCVHIPVGKQSA